MTALENNLADADRAISMCLREKLILPALAVLYSTIDVLGSLDPSDADGTRGGFTRWVDGYLLKAKALRCTALDLYAARCGVLHSFSADAALTRAGKARRLMYAWGTATAANLQTAAEITRRTGGTGEYVAIHLTDLFDAFRGGVSLFLADLAANPQIAAAAKTKSGTWFTNVSPEKINRLVELDRQRHDA